MLKQRLLTAAILLPLFIWAVFALSLSQFAGLIAFFIVIGSWEWTTLMGVNHLALRIVFSVVIVLMMVLLWSAQHYGYYLATPLLILSAVWWLIAFYLVLSYPKKTELWANRGVSFIIGTIILVPTWVALVALKSHESQGGLWVISLFLVIWAADTGAYFSGRKFGKTKLAASVSPGKSWEGAIGGLLLVLVVTSILITMTPAVTQERGGAMIFIIIALLTALVSILGDLTESMFKRRVSVKDSGKLLPGHGGVLDRIDSVTAAAPIFVLSLTFLLDFPFLQQAS
ncbi:MAG: CDP-archaeol synthase [Thiohalomonadales bacterium]